MMRVIAITSVVCPVSTKMEFFDVMTRETGTDISRALGPTQTVDTVANAIARAIERSVPEVYTSFSARVLVILNPFAPGLTDGLMKRFGPKPVTSEQR